MACFTRLILTVTPSRFSIRKISRKVPSSILILIVYISLLHLGVRSSGSVCRERICFDTNDRRWRSSWLRLPQCRLWNELKLLLFSSRTFFLRWSTEATANWKRTRVRRKYLFVATVQQLTTTLFLKLNIINPIASQPYWSRSKISSHSDLLETLSLWSSRR
jgi:hypothetical protein